MNNVNIATYSGLIVGIIAILMAVGMLFFPEKVSIIEDTNLQYLFAALCFLYGGFRVFRSVNELKAK